MKINRIIILVLGVFLFGSHVLARAEDVSKQVPVETGINKQELMDLITDADVKKSFTHQTWGERNPFDLSATDLNLPEVKTNFVLRGIFLGSKTPSAIINGVVMGRGDKLGEWTLKRIQENMVVLIDDDGNRSTLILHK